MRCLAAVRQVSRTRKGKTYHSTYLITSYWWIRHGIINDFIQKSLNEQPWEHCDGNIIAKVEAVDEPYFGGCSAVLEVTYKCDKCGNMHYPDLPNVNNISQFLTTFISEGM